MKAFSVLFVFSIILSLTSCNDNTQSVENGKINGQVLSYKTMKPIAGAYISTQPSTSNVMTDASGNFVLTDVVPNSYLLFANKFGYYQNYSSITIQSGKTVNAIILLKDSVVNNNPEKPLLLSPKDKATISSSEILLEWSCADPDNDYLTYDVIIDTNFLSGKIIFSNINQTKVVINNLISGKTYYWKIIAKDTLGAITESNIYSFNVTINHNPLKPVILSPDEGTIINGNEVQLEWSCTDPDNDNLTYDILMDTIVVVGKLIYQNITPNKVVVKNLISGKTYYWKIIAKDKSDLSSESNIYSFIVIINHNPNEPVLLSPVDGAIISKTYSQLNWSCYDPDNDNLTFDVYLDTNIFVEKIINTNITQTRITVNNLISGKTYYWKIIAKDNSGASSESDIYSFICDTTNNIPEDNSFVCYFPFNNDVDNYIKNYLTVSY
ncbi:MAG: carboxypeptidase-like regulatory domain-containing protein, partial [Ignavibacteriae bacterium]|nr:carboxypeptidase-like regulatory domain-containing protein [Ignavibacteriota bacterium]